ncbi:hypothetical protein BDV11DRAFT_208812 [Aspergillus similis]
MNRPQQQDLKSTGSYTVAWICALEEEKFCACRKLDEEYDEPEASEHYVVIGCLPAGRHGTNSAACVARDMVRTFPRLRFALMVGIGGGAPTTRNDIRLGDVVVSQPEDGFGGVIQYDLGKLKDGHFHRTGHLNAPPEKLLGLLDDTEDYQQPPTDRLYATDYLHVDGQNCDQCDPQSAVVRPERRSHRALHVHYGNIASGNSVLKDARVRDMYAQDPELNILCFEMEAAGLMNNVPCLVIRGICDYCDSHKNDDWHKYAARAAAAYARELLLVLRPQRVDAMPPWAERVEQELQQVDWEKLLPVQEASFDSYENQHEDQCLPGIRTDLLNIIMKWAQSPHGKSIFWLNGMAGTGKSTISRTIARMLLETNHLGASFFFKRGEGDRGTAKKIPGLSSGVQRVLRDDPDIASKSPREQFKKLLLQPLLTLDQLGRQPPITVIVIDALDECEHDQDIQAIIRLLPSLQEANGVSIRTFMTSRPELPIKLGFLEITGHEYQDLALHEIPEEDRFVMIKRNRNVSEDWPEDYIIQKLVKMSTPLFISAATSRLAELLANQAKYVSKMDKTYMPILTRLLDDQESDELEQQQLLQEFQDIIGVIILLAVPLSINALSVLLGIGADKISNQLDSFQSDPSSFRDFLIQSRTKFLVDEYEKHKAISKSCLDTMQRCLQKDICKLASPDMQRADIKIEYIRRYLPPALQYSCRYWAYHLKQSQLLSSSEVEDVRLFLQKYFLHWVEAMSLLGCISEVVGMLDLLHTDIIVQGDDTILANFLHDAKHFVLKNRQIADKVPLQIYYAGLKCQLSQVREKRSAELHASKGHSSWVQSLAFSPDGQLLASGSRDHTVRLWDPVKGAESQILEGHLDSVQSVAFSHDGLLLASSSDDGAIRLWDPAKSTELKTFESYLDSIHSVAFSPDGKLLAFGSANGKVSLWNIEKGTESHTLEGHSKSVQSVTFSPDGQWLASGSCDHTVRLWDPAAGKESHTLEGHSDWVQSVAFSPDGWLLASSSRDHTVRLWDPAIGKESHTLEGHSDPALGPGNRQSITHS